MDGLKFWAERLRVALRALGGRLKAFEERRRGKAWALLVALLALVAFFLFKPSPFPTQAKEVSPPPPPGAVLGEGEPSWGLVLWWRCPACQRLIALMEGEIAQGARFREPLGVYFIDLSEEDARATRYYLCLVEQGEDPWKSLAALKEKVQKGEDLTVPPSCPEGNRKREEWGEYFKRTGVLWTPAVLSKRGEAWYLEPPEERSYKGFLASVLGRGR